MILRSTIMEFDRNSQLKQKEAQARKKRKKREKKPKPKKSKRMDPSPLLNSSQNK